MPEGPLLRLISSSTLMFPSSHMRDRGYTVFACNRTPRHLQGDLCFHDLKSIPDGVDGFVMGQSRQRAVPIYAPARAYRYADSHLCSFQAERPLSSVLHATPPGCTWLIHENFYNLCRVAHARGRRARSLCVSWSYSWWESAWRGGACA